MCGADGLMCGYADVQMLLFRVLLLINEKVFASRKDFFIPIQNKLVLA